MYKQSTSTCFTFILVDMSCFKWMLLCVLFDYGYRHTSIMG